MAEDQKAEKKSEDVKPSLALVSAPEVPAKAVKAEEVSKAPEVESPSAVPDGIVRFTFADPKFSPMHIGHGGISFSFDLSQAPFLKTLEDFRVLTAIAPGKFVEVK